MKLFSFSEPKALPTAQELHARQIELNAELAKLTTHPVDSSSTIGRQVLNRREIIEQELLAIERSLDQILESNLHTNDTKGDEDAKYSVHH